MCVYIENMMYISRLRVSSSLHCTKTMEHTTLVGDCRDVLLDEKRVCVVFVLFCECI